MGNKSSIKINATVVLQFESHIKEDYVVMVKKYSGEQKSLVASFWKKEVIGNFQDKYRLVENESDQHFALNIQDE